MPSAGQVLEGLTAIANEWAGLALGWHVALAALLSALAFGWRPSRRAVASLLLLPLVSVSTLAWSTGNAFNGFVFAMLVLALAVSVRRVPPTPIRVHASPATAAGVGLVAFGWVYPHFLETDSLWTYAYAAPLGLIPCPTLAVLTGLTLVSGGFGVRGWVQLVAAAGLFYGAIGVLWLGVQLDVVLLGGAALLLWETRTATHAHPGRALENVIL